MGCLAVVLAFAGCGREGGAGGSGFCTLIGCAHPAVSVQVDQPGERPLEACVGAVCSRPGPVLVVDGVGLGDSVEVVVRVAGGGVEVARTTATPVTTRPNGPHCDPVCRSVRLRLTVDDRLVAA